MKYGQGLLRTRIEMGTTNIGITIDCIKALYCQQLCKGKADVSFTMMTNFDTKEWSIAKVKERYPNMVKWLNFHQSCDTEQLNAQMRRTYDGTGNSQGLGYKNARQNANLQSQVGKASDLGKKIMILTLLSAMMLNQQAERDEQLRLEREAKDREMAELRQELRERNSAVLPIMRLIEAYRLAGSKK